MFICGVAAKIMEARITASVLKRCVLSKVCFDVYIVRTMYLMCAARSCVGERNRERE